MNEIVVSDPETGESFRADESVRYYYEVRCGFHVEPPGIPPDPERKDRNERAGMDKSEVMQ